jgi:hypothetical protein
VAFDVVRESSPLLIAQHDIEIEVRESVMEVTECLIVSNESLTTYVGKPEVDEMPVTFQMSIPPNFDRVTFDSEFYGRRFRIVDHRMVTDIPWPPGKGKLKFTYRVPLEKSAGLFRRPLDLRSSNVRIRVKAKDPQHVTSNLPIVTLDDSDRVVMASAGKQLPAGYTIELQIGNMPIPWMLYARWGSLVALATLVLATFLVSGRRSRGGTTPQKSASLRESDMRRRSKTPRRAA